MLQNMSINIKPQRESKMMSSTILHDSKIKIATSFMTIPVGDWENILFTCSAGGLNQTLKQNTFCKRPDIEVLLPSCGNKAEENFVPVVCFISKFKPHGASVAWLKNGSPCNDTNDSAFKPIQGDDGLYFGRSSLKITKESWNKEDEYTCQVKYMTEYYMQNISKCLACAESFVTPTVEVELPCREDFLNDNATIKCLIMGTNPDANRVYLKFGDNKAISDHTGVNRGNGKVVFSYKVTYDQLKSVKEVSCMVKQPCSLPDVTTTKTLNLEDIKIKPPIMNILASCCDGNETGMVTLVCTISNFWPKNILVAWKGNGITYDNTTVVPLMLDGKGNYFATSKLKVPRESWYREEIYTCHVTHQKQYFKDEISICKEKPLSTDNSSVYHDDGGEELSESEEINSIWTTSSTFIALFLLTLIYSGCVTFVKVK